MEFIVGYDINDFIQLIKKVIQNSAEYQKLGNRFELGGLEPFEEEFLRDDPTQLIVWGDNQEVYGWIIWHPSRVKDHGDSTPRDDTDMKILTNLIGENEEFIELHELWLREEYRGKGYGAKIFDFFENFVLERGFKHFVYYAFNPAATHLCRKRGYREEFNEQLQWHTFSKTV